MTEPLKEQLSAFIDGELPRAEGELFVRQVPRDAELRAAAGRYYLIGQAIRAEQSSVRRGFSARIAAAVSREAPAAGVAASVGAGVTALARQLPGPRLMHWWKPVAGIAVAASVALVAILVVQNQQGAREIPQVADAQNPATVAAPAPRVEQATAPNPAGSNTNEPAHPYIVPPKGNAAEVPLTAARLASYVFAHSEYSSLPGRRNVVSDASSADDASAPAPAEGPAP
jgi:negative regulator of sigma E activity